jgi:hypothetical protein
MAGINDTRCSSTTSWSQSECSLQATVPRETPIIGIGIYRISRVEVPERLIILLGLLNESDVSYNMNISN